MTWRDEKIFIKHAQKDAYQIDARRYIVKNYKNSKFYQCDKCGILTPHNINDACVRDGCSGCLVEVDPDAVLATNFIVNSIRTKRLKAL